MSRARAIDVLLAVGLAAAGQFELWSGFLVGGPPLLVAPTVLVGSLVLVARRRAPMTTVVVAVGSSATVLGWLLGVDLNTTFGPLFAAFVAIGSAGYYARRPVLAAVVAVLLIWPAILAAKGLSVGDLLYAVVLVGLAWSVGRAAAAGALKAQLAEQRAAVTVAEERMRIARELHDVLAHSISVMALHAGGARRLLHPDQHAEREALLLVEQTGRDALTSTARVLGELRSPSTGGHPPVGLARVEELLTPLRAAGLVAELRVEGEPRPLPPEVDLAAYRIMQEALTNVLRHAAATRVRAHVHHERHGVRIEVADDGTGPAAGSGVGHGLIGMRERATACGGTLEAGATPGGGYRVVATLPVGAAAEAAT